MKSPVLAIVIVLVATGCAVIQSDPRSTWWQVGKCDLRRDGVAWCDARNRAWGQL